MTAAGLDLVLVNPSSRARAYQKLGTALAAVENPVWAGLIATFARRRGFSVEIVDADVEELTPAGAAAAVAALNPRLVAVVVYGHQPSASTQNMTGASAVVAAIKNQRPEAKVLMLGGHVAALPERTLREECCDYVARDEGLYGIADLLAALRETETPDVSRVRGLVYRDGAGVVFNPVAPLVTDLDRDMPGIAWDLLPMAKYRAHNWHCFGGLRRQPYASVYTTLGCPYHCTFCCIQAPFKEGERAMGLSSRVNSYRLWSPTQVIAEIDVLVNAYGVRNIKFADEMFVLHPRHVASICDLIIDRGYDLNIWAYARIDTVKDALLEKLKRAGFNWLAFGIEAADAGVLADVDKRYSVERVHDTVSKVKAAGINVIGNYIFGLPEDTTDTMNETLRLALDLKCEFANFYTAMAYPGSPLHEQATEERWPLPQTWGGYSQHSVDTLPLPTRYLSAGEVLQFRDRAFNTYFSDPAYLGYVERKFGPATVAEIVEMTSHRLERRHAAK